jgi:hypothetical protein
LSLGEQTTKLAPRHDQSSHRRRNFPAGGAFDTVLPKVVTVLAENDPLRDLDPKEAIDLRWTLRDIKAKRWKLSPINPTHLEKLKTMGLVELRNDELVLTNEGFGAIP